LFQADLENFTMKKKIATLLAVTRLFVIRVYVSINNITWLLSFQPITVKKTINQKSTEMMKNTSNEYRH